MNIIFKSAAVAAAAALAAATAYAMDSPATSSIAAYAAANVVVPVLISQTAMLSFGTFSSTTQGTIDTSGNVTGGVNKVTSGTPAAFAATGLSGASYTIAGDPTVALADSNNNSNIMVATLTYPNSPRTLTGGSDSFTVSGLLAVPAGQSSDSYTGTFNINVHY